MVYASLACFITTSVSIRRLQHASARPLKKENRLGRTPGTDFIEAGQQDSAAPTYIYKEMLTSFPGPTEKTVVEFVFCSAISLPRTDGENVN